MNIFGKQSNLPLIFSRTSDPKKEKSLVSFTHDQSIICSQTQLDDIAHQQTITCRQLFAGHLWTFGQWKEGKISIEWLQSLFFLNSSVGRGTPGMRLYTTVILEALFMFYLLRNYLCFLFFPHSLSSLLVRWSFHMLQPSLYQCVSSFPWCNWRNWFLKPNAELWCLLGLSFASGPGCLAIENFKLNLGGRSELIRFKEYYRMPRRHEHISFVFSGAFREIFSQSFLRIW